MAEAAVGNSPSPGSRAPLSATTLGLLIFVPTIVVVIVLFALDVVPLWLAAVILLADGFLTYFVTSKMEAANR